MKRLLFITAMGGHLPSSWSSRIASARPEPEQLEKLRHHGWRGGWIAPHRAFAYLPLNAKDLTVCVMLAAGMTLAWVSVLDRVGLLWGRIFRYWTEALGLQTTVFTAVHHLGGHHFPLPYLNLAAGPPDPQIWWISGAVTLALLAVTCFMSEEKLPWIYLLRFLVLLQGTALVYFVFAAARFPHDLPSYTAGMLYFGIVLISLIPAILGLTFYLFDFSLLKKIWLTLLVARYLTLFIPLQYMLHIYILQKSILFMPILYFAFGPFLDVLIFVSFYSWGMSWKSQNRLRQS